MVLETLAAIESTDRGRMVRAYAAIGRRGHGPLYCRRANGALRFVLTIDYGPSLPPSEIITRGLIDHYFDPLGRQLGGQSLTLGTRPAGRLRVGSGLPLGCRHRTLSEEHSHQRRIDDFRHFATFKIVRPQAPSILGQYRQIVL